MKPEEFKRQLDTHDWGFRYSNDARAYARGEENLARLKAHAAADPALKEIFDQHPKGRN